MEKLNIILNDGIEQEVYCMFYLYNNNYYFIYTKCDIDENGYVVLHLVQVRKEVQNTIDGSIETGYMIGVQIEDQDEWKNVQLSISKIVEGAKNGTVDPEIRMLPLSMISKLKIISEKTFRLMKDIVVNSLNIEIPEINNQTQQITNLSDNNITNPFEQTSVLEESNDATTDEDTIIIDYRTKFFEEQQKNAELQTQLDELNTKIMNIKNIIE